jgi:sugar phosphate isomerase/epimerase
MKTCRAVLAGAALGVATSFVIHTSAHEAVLRQEQPGSPVAVPPPVTGFPIGWCIRARPEAFNDAKRAGFEYVELALQDVFGLSNADFETLRAELESTGLRALSGYNPIPADLKIVGPDLDRVKEEAHLRTLLNRAAALKLTYIIFNSGASWRVPDGVAVDDAFAQLTAFARRFAEAAARDHITVLVEPLRSTDSNLITTVGDALRLVETVNQPNFAMMADYSFLTIQGEAPSVLVAAGSRLKHVHLANPANKRTYPMDERESDYAAFFAVLKRIGYRGGMSVHATTSAFATDAPRAIAFLRRAAADLRGPG